MAEQGETRVESARKDGSRPKRTRAPRAVRGRRAELNERLLVQLDALRAALAEMLERYELRVAGRLNELDQQVRGDDSLDLPPRPLTVKSAEAVLAAIDGVKLKPKKGRAKDLARIEALIDRLGEIAPPPP
jgi:hypothetical protein